MDHHYNRIENGDYEYLGSNIENCGELCLLKDNVLNFAIKGIVMNVWIYYTET